MNYLEKLDLFTVWGCLKQIKKISLIEKVLIPSSKNDLTVFLFFHFTCILVFIYVVSFSFFSYVFCNYYLNINIVT